jgi:cell wall-associated NlpC family hydrolase
MGSRNSKDHTCSRQVKPVELIVAARELVTLRTPYLHQGRTLYGLDCIGMIIYLLNKLELLPKGFERTDYGRLPMAELLEKAAAYCKEVPEPRDGCMVLIAWPGDQRPSHAALYADGNLIHCYAGIGKVVEHGHRKKWKDWTDSYWELPGVIYE